MSAQDPFAQDPIQPQSRLSGRKLLADALKNFVFSFSQGLAAQAQYPGRRGSQAGMAAALGGPQLLQQIEEQRRQQAQDRALKLEEFRRQVERGQLEDAMSKFKLFSGLPTPQTTMEAPRPAIGGMPSPLEGPSRTVGMPNPPMNIPGIGMVTPPNANDMAQAALQQVLSKAQIEAMFREPSNIDPLSAQGIQAAVERTRQESTIPPRPGQPAQPTPPLSPEAFNQRQKLAEITASLRQPPQVPQGNLQEVTGPDGKPALVRVVGTTVTPVTLPGGLTAGKPSVSPPGPAERNMLGFFERMNNAKGQIDDMQADIAKLNAAGQVRLRYAPNIIQTPLGQRFNQAANDFINASLRRESGAAISDAEYDRFSKIYFPQPGDTTDTLAQKKKARDVQLETIKTQAGRAYTEKYGAEQQPTVGDTVRIRAKDGTIGTIPRANLPEAIKRGATEVK